MSMVCQKLRGQEGEKNKSSCKTELAPLSQHVLAVGF